MSWRRPLTLSLALIILATARTAAQPLPPCTLPKASAEAKVVLLRAGADALSSVTVGSEDVATETGRIVIEPGPQPLFLVVSTIRPTIWRFSGALDRIERVVLAAFSNAPNRTDPNAPPLVGATGLPADRLTFSGGYRCYQLLADGPSNQDMTAANLVLRQTGQAPATFATGLPIAEVALPSGRFKASRAFRPMIIVNRQPGSMMIEGDPDRKIVIDPTVDLNYELTLFHPGGLVEIDPVTVVGSAPVRRYQVLPQQAGLLQLLREGAIEREPSGDFKILRKIRLPAELSGVQRLRVPRGVPLPDGEAGLACVMIEATGAPLPGSRC